MKLMSFFRSALIGALLCGAGTAVSQTAQPFPEGSATVELQDGAYYQLSQSLALTGTAERCAITMARAGWKRRTISENTTVLPSPVGRTINVDA